MNQNVPIVCDTMKSLFGLRNVDDDEIILSTIPNTNLYGYKYPSKYSLNILSKIVICTDMLYFAFSLTCNV